MSMSKANSSAVPRLILHKALRPGCCTVCHQLKVANRTGQRQMAYKQSHELRSGPFYLCKYLLICTAAGEHCMCTNNDMHCNIQCCALMDRQCNTHDGSCFKGNKMYRAEIGTEPQTHSFVKGQYWQSMLQLKKQTLTSSVPSCPGAPSDSYHERWLAFLCRTPRRHSPCSSYPLQLRRMPVSSEVRISDQLYIVSQDTIMHAKAGEDVAAICREQQ